MQISPQQQQALSAAQALSRGVLFITGKAGTGKSTILRELRRSGEYIVLASTGIAAQNVRGQTIHSFFGLRPGPLEDIRALGRRSSQALRAARAIVVDEISMVRSDLLDAMDKSLRLTTGKDERFGGIPMIFFGDAFQIEPVVSNSSEDQMLRDRYSSHFFFDSAALLGGMEVIELDEVFRQAGDPEFIAALNQLREGDMSGLSILNRRAFAIPKDDSIYITATNAKADAINTQRLNQIDAPEFCYEASKVGDFRGQCSAPEFLKLKVGARVMIVANKDGGSTYANGDLGYVVDLSETEILVELDRGGVELIELYEWETLAYTYEGGKLSADIIGMFVQFPLKLGWAVTTHKSQGQTFDHVHLTLETRAFAHGQSYVAISRCRTLEGLTLARELTDKDMFLDSRVSNWVASLAVAS